MPFAEAASNVVAPQFDVFEQLAIYTATFAAAIVLGGWLDKVQSEVQYE